MDKKTIDLVRLGDFLAALKSNLTGSLTDLGANVNNKNSLAQAINSIADALATLDTFARSIGPAPGDKILTMDEEGELHTHLNLVYDKAGKKIYLKGTDNVEIASIGTDDFVVDGMLKDAGLVTALPSGTTGHDGEKGPWLWFELNTDGGSKKVYVDVSSLVDTYSSGTSDYIEVEGYKIKAKTATLASTIDGLVSAADVRTELAKKQSVINGSNKLPASNVNGLATIATSGKLSDATQDATHRTVTDTEKSTWGGKQDALVFGTAYNPTTNKAATVKDIETTIVNSIASKEEVEALFS